MKLTDALEEKRTELSGKREELRQEIHTLQKKLDEVELELAAIDAYDDIMARGSHSKGAQLQARLNGGRVTREAVLAVITGVVGRGLERGEIIKALGVKGNRQGEVAVDNRLRELKREGKVLHEGRVYQTR